jgi:hypothetical protein
MEPEGSLPLLQEPATCPYPEPDQPSPCHQSHFLNIQVNIILPSKLDSSKCWGIGLQFNKLLIMLFSPLPSYLVPLRTKCSHRHSIFKHFGRIGPNWWIILTYDWKEKSLRIKLNSCGSDGSIFKFAVKPSDSIEGRERLTSWCLLPSHEESI